MQRQGSEIVNEHNNNTVDIENNPTINESSAVSTDGDKDTSLTSVSATVAEALQNLISWSSNQLVQVL